MMGIRHLVVLLGAVGVMVLVEGCSRCGGSGTEQRAAEASSGTIGDAAVAPDARQRADGSPRPQARADAAAGASHGPSPVIVAQRFVVGWASGRVEPLVELSDGEALALVRRALAGETVDTPLGRLAPDRPVARNYRFSDRQVTIAGPIHRIRFTMSAQMGEGPPVVPHPVVEVREHDRKVIRGIAPWPPGDGGV